LSWDLVAEHHAVLNSAGTYQVNESVVAFVAGCLLCYNEKVALGERTTSASGDVGPVSELLGGSCSPAIFLLDGAR